MVLYLEGNAVEAACDESLLSLVRREGLDADTLRQKPLAAQIGGEVYTLNFNPIHKTEQGEELRSNVKKAGGRVKLLRYSDTMGRRVYERSLKYVVFMAIRRLWPQARVMEHYSLGAGVYMTIEKTPSLCEADLQLLEAECRGIIQADLPLLRERLPIETAIDFYRGEGFADKVRLLKWRQFNYFDCYRQEDYLDYFYGEMTPSTGYVHVFGLQFVAPGMLMLLPNDADPERLGVYTHSPKLASVFAQSDNWGRLMRCDTVAELNAMVQDGSVRELVRINEALHEKSYAQIADAIVCRGARAVMVAGPSSSGKTTSANRLYTHLRVLGKSPVLLSLDNYYVDRDKLLPDESGEVDLEHIDALDVARFNSDLERLITGQEVEVPVFDFKTGRRAPQGLRIRVGEDEPLIIEGIHGLNPRMLSPAIHKDSVFRVYVSALTTLNLDDHNRIRTTDMRLLRRMVRDYETRGASVEHTFSMWSSVQKGERVWIFPFQEEADALFNTTLVYELAVLKKHIFPLLLKVQPESEYYADAHGIIKFLNYVQDADIEDEIPPTSILREFIGGNTFYRE
ncbi:MAG: nucleoside kinase [Christensenellaceae bacterium]|jgi:uridine kinase|nr:nucleoside kinase [Christensenellaceae bacterium]